MPNQLLKESLWWQGPDWLVKKWEQWIRPPENHATHLDQRDERLTFTTQVGQEIKPFESLVSRYSTLAKLVRVIAFILRWRRNTQLRKEERTNRPLSASELLYARRVAIRATQVEHYAKERGRIIAGQPLRGQGPLQRFLPFIDADGILRIGGRLQNAPLKHEEKYPAIIPSESHLAELLIRDAHLRTMHGGPQLVSSDLARAYWIVRARNRIRRLTNQCVRCTRFRGQFQVQQMAPLPSCRVTPARPFASTGLDYAGPYLLRASKGRGIKAYKGYIAIFVCMVTRAIHIEIVSDYTTQAFLMAFRRFISRRGRCTTIYSDNGTTFQGASAEIKRLFDAATEMNQEIVSALAADGTEWKFIPPRAPHFGGLWEAGVKAAKHHLRRVMGDAKLSFEEFSTLTTQIEACLNSRPLSPLSNNPEDLVALTPGHFLIGTALTALPEPFDLDSNITYASRYKMITQMRNHFWKRWHREVLQQMQQRSKWTEANATIAEGDLVLLTDDLVAPAKWPLARVTSCHPGPDGLTRVLSLKTATTTLQRPLVRVIRLPVEASELAAPDLVKAGGSSGSDARAESVSLKGDKNTLTPGNVI